MCALCGAHFAANAAAVSLQSPQSDLSVKAGLPRRLSDAEILQVTAGAVRCFWGLPEGNVLREAAYGELAKKYPVARGALEELGSSEGNRCAFAAPPLCPPGQAASRRGRHKEKIFAQEGKNACLYAQTLLKYRSTLNIGVSPSGKATDSDSVIRWFESSYPSQFESCYHYLITTLFFLCFCYNKM